MPQLNHAADSPLRALALITQHRNARMCRSVTERVEMVWRPADPGTWRCSATRRRGAGRCGTGRGVTLG